MSERITTITASDFHRDNYAENIARGDCEVTTTYGQKIRSLSKSRTEEPYYMIWPLNDREVAGFLTSDDEIFVTWLDKQPVLAEAQAPAADANGAAGEGLRIGQLVRYTSKQSNEIAYGAFGVVKAVDMLTGWYDVLFFDYEGLRAINGIVLQSVLPENCNRAEAELTRLRSELDAARGALAEFVRIDDTCQAYSNTGLADFTETCAYVGRRPIEDALKRAKELSQP